MKKRGQITLFLIVAAVMILSIGAGLYFLLRSGPDVEQPSLTTTAGLEATSNSMRTFVQNCLEKKTLEAIDNYGIKTGYSEELIKNYIDATMVECVDFAFFERKGYVVTQNGLGSSVGIYDDAVIVELDFPIRISNKAGTNVVELNDFEYNIQRSTSYKLGEGGVVPALAKVVSEDGDAELLIRARTAAYMQDGSPVDEISIRMEDKNFNGLSNNVVIGTTVYRAEPDGAWFDPAITARFTIDYADVPAGVRYTTLKCAYYDETSDIWRTYETVDVKDNGAGERTYTVVCKVPHFSIIAVVQCGSSDTQFGLYFDPAFRNPLPPEELLKAEDAEKVDEALSYWLKNDMPDNVDATDKGGDVENLGIHLIPEKTVIPTSCNPSNEDAEPAAEIDTTLPVAFPEATGSILNTVLQPGVVDTKVHFYSGTELGAPTEPPYTEFDSVTQSDEYCNTYLLQDWDNDDNPNFDTTTHEIQFVKEDWTEITPNNFDTIKDGCYASCKDEATKIVKAKFPNLVFDENTDNINDYIGVLYCTATELKEQECDPNGANCKWVPTGYYMSPVCKFETAISEQYPFDNIAAPYELSKEFTTMDYPVNIEGEVADGRKFALVATPKTYGYAKTIGTEITELAYGEEFESTLKENLFLGGYAEMVLELETGGNACVMEQFTPLDQEGYPNAEVSLQKITYDESLEILPVNDVGVLSKAIGGGDPIVLNEGGEAGEDHDTLCSEFDTCIWTINDPLTVSDTETTAVIAKQKETYGKLRGGTNYIRVYVQNLAEETKNPIDPIFWAKAQFRFIGMGLKEETFGGGDVTGSGTGSGAAQNCWCVQVSETEFTGCALSESMPFDGQTWVKKDGMCGGEGMPTFCSEAERPIFYKCEVPLGCIIAEEVVGEKGCQDDVYDCHYCNDIDPSKVCCAQMMKVPGCDSILGCVPKDICADAGGTEIIEGNEPCNTFEAGRVCCQGYNTIEECPNAPGCVDPGQCAEEDVIATGTEGCRAKIGDKVCCAKLIEEPEVAGCPTSLGCVEADSCTEDKFIITTQNSYCVETAGEGAVCCEEPKETENCKLPIGGCINSTLCTSSNGLSPITEFSQECATEYGEDIACCGKGDAEGCATPLGCIVSDLCAGTGMVVVPEGEEACKAEDENLVCCDAQNKIEGCETDLGCLDSNLCTGDFGQADSGSDLCAASFGDGMVCCETGGQQVSECTLSLGCTTIDECRIDQGREAPDIAMNSYCVNEKGAAYVCCKES